MNRAIFHPFLCLVFASVAFFFAFAASSPSNSKRGKSPVKKIAKAQNAPKFCRLSVPWSLHTWTLPRESKAAKKSKNPGSLSLKQPPQMAEVSEHGPIFSLDELWRSIEDYVEDTAHASSHSYSNKIGSRCDNREEDKNDTFKPCNMAFLLLKQQLDPIQVPMATTVSLKLPRKRDHFDPLLNGILAEASQDPTSPFLGFVLVWHVHISFLKFWLAANDRQDPLKAVNVRLDRYMPGHEDVGKVFTYALEDDLRLITSAGLIKSEISICTEPSEPPYVTASVPDEPLSKADAISIDQEGNTLFSSILASKPVKPLNPQATPFVFTPRATEAKPLELKSEEAQDQSCDQSSSLESSQCCLNRSQQIGSDLHLTKDLFVYDASYDDITIEASRADENVFTPIACPDALKHPLSDPSDLAWIQSCADLEWDVFETFVKACFPKLSTRPFQLKNAVDPNKQDI
jgi:hypothetical protein